MASPGSTDAERTYAWSHQDRKVAETFREQLRLGWTDVDELWCLDAQPLNPGEGIQEAA